jgi:hypothetical protein
MRRESTIRKIIAVLAIVSVFTGTQGFVVSSHTCNSCGTHEEAISLFGSMAGSGHDCSDGGSQSCCNEAETPGANENSCCTPPENKNVAGNKPLTVADTPDSCCSTEATSCETFNGGACCEYETEKITVEPYKQERQEKINITSIPAPEASTQLPEPATSHITPVANLHNKHGGTEIIRFICCYLI